MAVRVLGVTVNDAHVSNLSVSGTTLVTVREMAAICATAEYEAMEPTTESVQSSFDILTRYGTRGPVVPAPFGVVFRSEEAVQRWLELHYGALSSGMTYVENRVAARVHIWRPGVPEERETGSDLAAVAAEALRILRRSAVASLPLRMEKVTGIVLSAGFLVEAELFKAFTADVHEQQKAHPGLKLELTGPWPPYDFVQMRLGA